MLWSTGQCCAITVSYKERRKELWLFCLEEKAQVSLLKVVFKSSKENGVRIFSGISNDRTRGTGS